MPKKRVNRNDYDSDELDKLIETVTRYMVINSTNNDANKADNTADTKDKKYLQVCGEITPIVRPKLKKDKDV